jgi:hypothetical protein
MKRRRCKALEIANAQYQNLKDKLSNSTNIEERNLIYRRMINLLEVINFLNTQNALALQD